MFSFLKKENHFDKENKNKKIKGRWMIMQTRVIILLIFSLLVAIFAVMNIQPVSIDFFLGKTEVPLIFVLIVSILTGALFMFILSSMKQLQLTRKIKSLDKENAQLKQELEKLKQESPSEPMADSTENQH